MPRFKLTCNSCKKEDNYFCSREKVIEVKCGYCGKKDLEYVFSNNMTTGMIRTSINGLSGKEKLERIQKDMRESFKLIDISDKATVKREDDFKVDWPSVGE